MIKQTCSNNAWYEIRDKKQLPFALESSRSTAEVETPASLHWSSLSSPPLAFSWKTGIQVFLSGDYCVTGWRAETRVLVVWRLQNLTVSFSWFGILSHGTGGVARRVVVHRLRMRNLAAWIGQVSWENKKSPLPERTPTKWMTLDLVFHKIKGHQL